MKNLIFKTYQEVRCYSINGPIKEDPNDVILDHVGRLVKGNKDCPQFKVAAWVCSQQHAVNRTPSDYEVRVLLPEEGDFIGKCSIRSVSFDMDQIVIMTD